MIAGQGSSSVLTGAGRPALLRFAYDSAAKTYRLDPGFPVTIGDFSTEALVIDEDSKGTVWAAWTQSQRIRIAHSLAADTSWVAFYLGLVPGSSLASAASCAGGVPIGLGAPYALLGTARADSVGIATLAFFVPATTPKGIFLFQAVDHSTCRASNLASEDY